MKEIIDTGIPVILADGMLLGILAFQDVRKKRVDLLLVILLAIVNTVICLLMKRSAGDVCIGILPGVFAVLVALLTKGKLGLGDGLVLIATGVVYDWNRVMVIWLVGLVLSTVVGAVLIMMKKANIKTALPFLPFLFTGFVVLETVERIAK